jgi:hypothetical protein
MTSILSFPSFLPFHSIHSIPVEKEGSWSSRNGRDVWLGRSGWNGGNPAGTTKRRRRTPWQTITQA